MPTSLSNVVSLEDKHALETRNYYARADSILRSYSTVSPQVQQSSEAPTVQTSVLQHGTTQGRGYARHTKLSTVLIPAHLKVLYDELYEACWTGDNATIQELCLPKHLAEDKEPIQISVQASTAIGSFGYIFGVLQSVLSAEAE